MMAKTAMMKKNIAANEWNAATAFSHALIRVRADAIVDANEIGSDGMKIKVEC
jgi:hypothetical protein